MMTQEEFLEKWRDANTPKAWSGEAMRLFLILSYDPDAPRMKELSEDFLSIKGFKGGMAYDRATRIAAT